ncbi:MAG: N-acetyl-gamma-glutamyl-phosphate reductase [Anaerolineae bacterium]|nr:N-acetyl-gamma-glutamyl-phosphate reductase [Anaerolineae bacterium]
MIRAGIFGATGYTGFELVQILNRHPSVTIAFATSESYAGQTLDMIFPTAPAIELVRSEDAPLDSADTVFLCLPHAAAAATAVRALNAGLRVIDLSADFRLKDVETYNAWYGVAHPAPKLLNEAVYGLTEIARDQLPTARLVACPGCYPTSVLLAVKPILEAGLATGTIIADSKSGVSGAGRAPKQHTHFVEASNNFSPYNIGRKHRHLPEIEQVMHWFDPDAPDLIFSPHLLPVPRGILSTVYIPVGAVDEATLRDLYTPYDTEPFIHVLPAGQLATLAHVVHTNHCVMALTKVNGMLIVTSAIDNLLKGAAGQAVQNMNVMFGLDETTELL